MTMFIDRAVIFVRSGNGGHGIAAFHREKFVAAGGPDGGDGGKGGDLIFVADKHLTSLVDYYYKTKYVAENGSQGGPKNCFGKAGQDLVLKVPLGTVIRDRESGNIIADMFTDGQRKVVLVGGDRTSSEFENKVNDYFHAHGCNIHLSKGYSMTEASATATFSFEEINKAGGVNVNGEMMDFEIIDFVNDEADAGKAATALTKLILFL